MGCSHHIAAITDSDIDRKSAPPPLEMFNPDILLYLLQFVASKRDLSALMKTCKFLHRGGVSHILKSTVLLKKHRSCLSFNLFMTSKRNTPDRFQFLRKLTLHIPFGELLPSEGNFRFNLMSLSSPDSPHRNLDLLVVVLHLATNLRELEIGGNTEHFLYKLPGLSAAIASLPSLTRLSFPDGVGQTSGRIFGDIKSRPTSIKILIPWGQRADEVLRLLTPVQNSLTELDYRWALPGSTVPIFPPGTARFPNLRTLILQQSGHLSVPAMVHIFPKLARLTIESTPVRSLGGRFLTHALQPGQGTTLGQSSSSWARLESLKGTLDVLRSLGLRCPVDHIHIDNYISTSDVPHLLALLKDLHPKSLHLTFSLEDYPKDSLPSTLIKILEESELTHFTLSLNVNLDTFSVFPVSVFIVSTSIAGSSNVHTPIFTICRTLPIFSRTRQST